MAFTEKFLDFQFNLGVTPNNGVQRTFSEGGNQLYISGLRATADIAVAGGLSMGTASCAIYGMTLSQMNQLATLGINPLLIGPNFVSILAYEAGANPTLIYQGAIVKGWIDGNAMPNVPFRVEAAAGLYEAIAPCPPRSYSGPISAADVIKALASQMGRSFTNYGVKVMLPPGTYFYGAARNQALKCAKAGGFNISWDISPNNPGNGVIIWAKNQELNTSDIEVSKNTGMKTYPTFTSNGIQVETAFNQAIGFWSTIKLVSSLTAANGKYVVVSLAHNLSTQVPGGPWFTTLQGVPLSGISNSPGFAGLPP